VANYNVDIAVAVTNSQAIARLSKDVNSANSGINKLIDSTRQFQKIFNDAFSKNSGKFFLEQKRKELTASKAITGELQQQLRLAVKLGQAFDRLRVKEVGTGFRVLERAQSAQKLLTGGFVGQKALPASTSGKSIALQREQDQAIAAETKLRKEILEATARQLRSDEAIAAAKLKLEQAANLGASEATRIGQPRKGNVQPFLERPRTTSSVFQQKLQVEVDRQIRETGKLSNEIVETVSKYNQLQTSTDKLIKTQGRLSTEVVKPKPQTKAGGGTGGGNKGLSDLALGVGFPLLFGGGAGSIAGGALGSVGGMGGQVLGSAIGAIVDQAVASVAELGQALNPFTADVKAVTAAAGESGTAFERLVSELEEVAGKEKALEVATAQLATIIGNKGVDALKEFGDASSDLSNELSKAFTALGAALAPVLADITRATANAVERSRLVNKGTNDLRDDPRVQQIKADLSARKIGEIEAEDKIAELVRQLELEEQIKIAKQAQADLQAKIDEKTSSSIYLTEQKLVIEQNGGDILNEQVQTALQNIDADKIRLKILEAQGDQLKINLAFKQGQLLAAIRIAKIEAAEEAKRAKDQREAEAATRKAAREQEARDREAKQLQQSIFNEDLKQVQIQSKINQFYQGDIEAIQTQKQELELVLNARIDQIKITTEDLTLQNEKIQTLKMQAQLELASLDRSQEQLLLAEQVSALSAAAGFNVLGLANDTGAVQDRGIYGSDTGPVSFEEGIELAPLIAYQVELDKILEKYPMIGEAASAAAGLITTGFESIIDGTKSAEEVFSDFLRSIADMLMKTAQQMIAQYIAIAIAKMFAGMGSSFSGGSFSDFNGVGGNPFTTPSSISPFAGFPTFADGGRPPVGRPSIIGERGPELFVPGASGTIIPNHAMGGTNVVVNVDASGSSAQGDGQQAKKLGSVIGAAVQAELVKQKRPGGLLAA